MGGVVGGVAFSILVFVAVFCHRRRTRIKMQPGITPYSKALDSPPAYAHSGDISAELRSEVQIILREMGEIGNESLPEYSSL